MSEHQQIDCPGPSALGKLGGVAFMRLKLAHLPEWAAIIAPGLLLLLWPAIWNGYPIVFADTGTYLSQAIRHYLGWDRPPFYSIFLFAFHWKITVWPAILAQAGMTIYFLMLALRAFAPAAPRWLLPVVAGLLCIATPLPWYASELMPDLFTGLLVVALAVLVLRPGQIAAWELNGVAALAAWMIAAHLSNLWITVGLLAILVPCRRLLGATQRLGWQGFARAAAPLLLASLALASMNFVGFHRFSLSPFGNVFVLSRVIYDGPGEATLERDCRTEHWDLCRHLHELPPHDVKYPTSDFFLWTADGPLAQLGGAKHFSREAGEIIARTLQEHLFEVMGNGFSNLGRQLLKFRSGDGFNPWPAQVGPVIGGYFPKREARAFLASRQSQGKLFVPSWIKLLHGLGFWAGFAATSLCMVVAARRRDPSALLCAAVLLCILGNAAVTGALSGPHDRYQNRVIWLVGLAPCVAGYAIRKTSRAAVAGLGAPGFNLGEAVVAGAQAAAA